MINPKSKANKIISPHFISARWERDPEKEYTIFSQKTNYCVPRTNLPLFSFIFDTLVEITTNGWVQRSHKFRPLGRLSIPDRKIRQRHKKRNLLRKPNISMNSMKIFLKQVHHHHRLICCFFATGGGVVSFHNFF